MLEQLSNEADGNYAFIDTPREVCRVLVDQLHGTLVTIAKDVKVQVEFNPSHIGSYRLIGYENRRLEREDFQDDTKDAGDIGAGHRVTALYELIPLAAESAGSVRPVNPLKYQAPRTWTSATDSDELMTVSLRYKRPDQDVSREIILPVENAPQPFDQASPDFRFAAAVAAFGMLLRQSEHCGRTSFDMVAELARAARGRDTAGHRAEFLQIVDAARRIARPRQVRLAPIRGSIGPPMLTPPRKELPPARLRLIGEMVWLIPLVLLGGLGGLGLGVLVGGLLWHAGSSRTPTETARISGVKKSFAN
jgi:Ca-activated chloride channel family protein